MVYFYAKLENLIVADIRVVATGVVETAKGVDFALGSELLAELHGGSANDFLVCPIESDGTTRVTKGFTYDLAREAFIPPQPFNSWVLNEETLIWEAPVLRPDGDWFWDEETGDWVAVETPGA